MKRKVPIKRKLQGLVLLPILLVVMYAQFLGLVFGASMVVAGIVGWGFGLKAALIYLSFAWKAYAVIGIVTFAFLATFSYQNCCVGIESFGGHLKHRGLSSAAGDVLGGIVWPWCWFEVDYSLNGWGMGFGNAFLRTITYWLETILRRPQNVTLLNLKTGETTIYAQTSRKD
jgi:hypothetical protein